MMTWLLKITQRHKLGLRGISQWIGSMARRRRLTISFTIQLLGLSKTWSPESPNLLPSKNWKAWKSPPPDYHQQHLDYCYHHWVGHVIEIYFLIATTLIIIIL